MKFINTFIVICLFSIFGNAQWVKQTVDTTASFRGLSVVNEKIVWASGTAGTVIRTVDGGKTWNIFTVPGAEKLDFRDIEAFDANTAYILSIGNGDASRIYMTTDGGNTWRLQFKNKDEKAFFDAMACWARNDCIAMSDPVDGSFLITQSVYVVTSRRFPGTIWTPTRNISTPKAAEGEAAFAASGTCLIVNGKNDVYLVSGGSNARVFRSSDRGSTWSVADTPMPKGTPGSGIFSIAMFGEKIGVIVGGNYEKPDEAVNNLAFTRDGGKTWARGFGLSGYRSAVAFIDAKTIIAVGTNGTDISFDSGLSWRSIGSENLNSVAAKGIRAVWAVGPTGWVTRLEPSTIK
jgi:photosystem II stability/assembly factor-like uncharacterized protein